MLVIVRVVVTVSDITTETVDTFRALTKMKYYIPQITNYRLIDVNGFFVVSCCFDSFSVVPFLLAPEFALISSSFRTVLLIFPRTCCTGKPNIPIWN